MKGKVVKAEHKIKTITWWWYSLIGIIGLIVVGMIVYGFQKSSRVNTVYAPLIDAAMEIKLEASTAHLRFEEILIGDRKEDTEAVWKHLDQADWYARAMLEGGENSEGTFFPLDDTQMRKNIIEVRAKLAEFTNITKQRLIAKKSSITSSDIDQRYEVVFENFITQADEVETRLQQVMAQDLSHFRFVQKTLIAISSLLSLFVGITFYRFDRNRIKDTLEIYDVNERLKKEINERKRVEEELKVLNESLERRVDERTKKLVGKSKKLMSEIATRQQAEEMFQKSKRQFYTLVEASPYVIFHTDVRGKAIYVSKHWSKLSGLTDGSWKDDGWVNAVHPEVRAEVFRSWQQAVTKKKSFQKEFRFRHINGTTFWILAFSKPIFTETGNIEGFIGITIEITERKRLEEKLKALNKSLGQRVEERTAELAEKNEKLLEEISERKQAEEEIKSLAKFPSENPNPVLRVERNGTILFTNNAGSIFLDNWGTQTGQSVPDDWHKNALDVLCSGKSKDYEMKCNDHMFSMTLAPVVEKGYVNFYGLDITERKRVEEELKVLNESLERRVDERTKKLVEKSEKLMSEIVTRERMEFALKESEERYRQIVSTTRDAIMVFDAKTRQFIEVNKACEELYGYSREEFLNMRHSDITNAPEITDESIFKTIAGELQDIPLRYHRKKDGTVFPVEISASAFTYKGQKVLCGIIRDITERKKKEEELKDYGILFDNISDMAYICDIEGNILFLNKVFEKLSGCKSEEFIGKSFALLFDGEDLKKAMDLCSRTLKGESLQKEVYFKDTGVLCEYKNLPLRNEKGKIIGVLGTARDITERKKVEEQIKASLKEKEVLLKEIHHRVKNNLQIVSSLLDMGSMQTQNQEVINLIMDCRNRINSIAIVHSQLYKSELLNQIDMEQHIEELSKRLLQIYEMEKTITLNIKPTDVSLPITRAVPCALVLNELISNSLKHAYKNGQKGKIDISIQRSDGDVFSIKVKDDGIGIPEEIDIDKTNSLGLSLVRNIVFRQLRGKLYITRNGGTEIAIEFKALKGEIKYEQSDVSR